MVRKFSFENLEVYGKARSLVSDVYRIQKNFPKEEIYGLGDQVRRAAVSITACDLGYITDEQFNTLRPRFTDIAKMLSGLRNSLEKQINNQ